MRDMENDRGQLGPFNVLVAGGAGAVAFLAILIFGVPGLDPSMWNDVAVVAGLRPPAAIFPGIWRVLTGWMFSLFGVEGALGILKFAGAATAGVCTALLCLIARILLSLLIRTSQPYAVWSNRLAPYFALVAGLLFAVSEPLFRISRVFSPELLRLSMFLAIIYLSLRWFTVGGRWRVFTAMTLMGVLAAETPLAFVLPLLFIGFYAAVWHCVMDGLFPKPEKFEEPETLPKWRMFFLFLGGVAAAAWVIVTILNLFK